MPTMEAAEFFEILRVKQKLLGRQVQTPLGRGKIIHLLVDGTGVVELDSGGGVIYPVSVLKGYLRGELPNANQESLS